MRPKFHSYKLIIVLFLNIFPMLLTAHNGEYSGIRDSIIQKIRFQSHLLINPEELNPGQLDTLLQNQIPLAFLYSAGNNDKLRDLVSIISKRNLPALVISKDDRLFDEQKNAKIFVFTESDLDKINISETGARKELNCNGLVWMFDSTDSLLIAERIFRFWETTGKMPNFIQANAVNCHQISRIVSLLNRQSKIFGVVKNGSDLLVNVLWKDYPTRITNGYFSFPVDSFSNFPLSPYKAGYQFSPDIILPSPENLQNLKIFNAVPLDPEFGLTDQFNFSKRIRNLKRKNDDEIIPYGVDFVKDDVRGNCAFFSGKAYLDGGLQSRSALKPSFSITAWIKPSELDANNCILGKGKDFVLKIHNGLLTFTVQGIKDYFSKKTLIPLNKWSFISLVHNGPANQISFYLDGELTETISLLTPYSESDYTMLVGSNLWEEFFVGLMGEIKIWNRELNEGEIKNEYSIENTDGQSIFSRWYVWFILSIVIAGSYVFLHFLRRKQQDNPTKLNPSNGKVKNSDVSVGHSPEKEHTQCFGGLKVFNREGKDISTKFSPKLKQLFVLIFLHSFDEPKGINSKNMSDYLWPGMSKQNAKNTRGTNIQNLKAILSSCSGLKLVFQDKHWVLEFADDYFNEFAFVDAKLNEMEGTDDIDTRIGIFSKLLPILKKGTLFPNMSELWVDPYIDSMSNRIIEIGQHFFAEMEQETYDSFLLNIAEIISINDPLNEAALRKKINILTRQGKLSFAHSVFDNFTKLYFDLYQEKYSSDFKSLIVS